MAVDYRTFAFKNAADTRDRLEQLSNSFSGRRNQLGYGTYVENDAYHPTAFLAIDRDCPQYRKSQWQQNPHGDILPFSYLSDESFSDGASANWADVNILGRSEAYKIYSFTSNRVIAFTLAFMAVGNDSPHKEVKKRCDWLRALAYPFYEEDGTMLPPPTVFLSFGSLFPVLRGIVPDPQITYMGPFDGGSDGSGDLVPMQATVAINFTVVNVIPQGSDNILLEGNY